MSGIDNLLTDNPVLANLLLQCAQESSDAQINEVIVRVEDSNHLILSAETDDDPPEELYAIPVLIQNDSLRAYIEDSLADISDRGGRSTFKNLLHDLSDYSVADALELCTLVAETIKKLEKTLGSRLDPAEAARGIAPVSGGGSGPQRRDRET